MTRRRATPAGALPGLVVGPVVLTSIWAVLGHGRNAYSPVRDPISRMAAVGADGRIVMTGGFVVYGVAVGAGALSLRRISDVEPLASPPAVLAGAAGMLGLAALPLGARFGDGPHLAAGALTYSALAVTPLVPAARLRRNGDREVAALALGTAVVTGAAFIASRAHPRRQGLFQRVGLVGSGAWTVAAGLAAMRSGGHGRGRGIVEPVRQP